MSRQQFEYHPRIGYRFIPHLKARIPHESGGYLVSANAQGFRCGHDFVAPKRPGVKRVLLFGDSFTAGDGVRNEVRFGDRLEQLVPGLEVYNFGLPGTGTDQHYLCFQEYAAGIEKDLVVVALQVENIRRVVAKYREFEDDRGKTLLYAKPYFERGPSGSLSLRNVPVPREPLEPHSVPEEEKHLVDHGGRYQALRTVIGALGLKQITQRLTGYQPCPEYEDASHPSWLVMSAILKEWTAGAGAPVLVVPLPLYHYVEEMSDPSPYQQRFRELAGSLQCIVHDPLPDLLAHDPARRRAFRFAKDVHPTPEGHEALARSLAPVLALCLDLSLVESEGACR